MSFSTPADAYRRRQTPRQGEAAVFAEANRRLRAAQTDQDLVRALADNRRLWNAVLDLVSDPGNELAIAMRAQIASVAHAVLRECGAPAPDVAFLTETNTDFAEALWN